MEPSSSAPPAPVLFCFVESSAIFLLRVASMWGKLQEEMFYVDLFYLKINH